MSKEMSITGFKVNQWYNQKTKEILFGVDVKVNGVWHHLKDGDDDCIYKTKKEAAKKIKDYSKEHGLL